MSKILTATIIYLCSFQLAFGQVVSRIPASKSAKEVERAVEKLSKKMRSIRRSIRGDYLCTDLKIINFKAPSDNDFSTNWGDLKQTIGGLQKKNEDEYYGYLGKIINLDHQDSPYMSLADNTPKSSQDPNCRRGKDLLTIITEKVSEIDISDEDAQLNIENEIRSINMLVKDAMSVKRQVQSIIEEDSLENRYKEMLIARYIEDIAVTIHDLKVVLRPFKLYEDIEEEDFFFPISTDLFGFDGERISSLLTKGLMSTLGAGGQSIYEFMELYKVNIDVDDDKLNLSFDPYFMSQQRDLSTFMKFPLAKNYLLALRMLTVGMMSSQVAFYDMLLGKHGRPIEMPSSCVDSTQSGKWPDKLMLNVFNDEDLMNVYRNSGRETLIQQMLNDQGFVYIPDVESEEDEFVTGEEDNSVAEQEQALVGNQDVSANYLVKQHLVETDDINPVEYGSVENLSYHNYKNAFLFLKGKEAHIDETTSEWWARQGKSFLGFITRQDIHEFKYYNRPMVNDVTMWEDFKSIVMPEVQSIYNKEVSRRAEKAREAKTEIRTFRDYQLINDILTFVNDTDQDKSFTINGDDEDKENDIVVDLAEHHVSKFIGHIYKERQIDPYSLENGALDLLSDATKKRLKYKKIKINMPSMNSHPDYRNWGLLEMERVLQEVVDRSYQDVNGKKEYKIANADASVLFQICSNSRAKICKDSDKKTFEQLLDFVQSLRVGGKYIPFTEIENEQLDENYELLAKAWNYFRDQHRAIPMAVTNEFDLLKIKASESTGHLARARLGYLLAKDYLQGIHEGVVNADFTLEGDKVAKTRASKKSQARKRYIKKYNLLGKLDGQMRRLEESAEILLIDKPLYIEHISRYASKEVEMELWKKTLENIEKDTRSLLTAKSDGQRIIDNLTKIASRRIVDMDDFDDVVFDILDNEFDSDIRDMLEKVLDEDKENQEKIKAFKKFVKAKTIEEKEELFKEFEDDYSEFEIKEMIFNNDNLFKRFLYDNEIRKAANIRRYETLRSLDTFCSADDNDHEKLKEVFQSTIKIQDKINEMSGLQGAPEELMDRIDSMTTEEWANMGFAVGAFFVPMAMTMGAKFLIGVAGVAFGPIYLAVVLGGIALQAHVTISEMNMKRRADVMARNVHHMSELGFTTSEAWDSLARGWVYTIIEGVSIVPLLGMALRGINVGAKVTKNIISQTMKNSTKLGLRRAYKHAKESSKLIVDDADVDLAKIVLGLGNYSDVAKNFFKKTKIQRLLEKFPKNLPESRVKVYRAKMKALRESADQGVITKAVYANGIKELVEQANKEFMKKSGNVVEYVAKNVIDLDFNTIDKATAETLKRMLKNPRSMRDFMDTYMKKFDMPMRKYSGQRKTKFFSGKVKETGAEKAIASYEKAKSGGHIWGTNWIKKAWYENTYNLAKNQDSFLRIYNELRTLPEDQFESYLLKNLDALTDMFVKAPLRLPLDIPYLFIQGGPHLGVRIPGINSMGEAIIVRKIMNARARLTAEASKSMAREMLGMAKVNAGDQFSKIFKNLFSSGRSEAKLLGEKEGAELLENLESLKKVIVGELKKSLSGNEKFKKLARKNNVDIFTQSGELHASKLKRAMFNPSTIEEETVMNAAMGFINQKKIFNIPEIEFIAYKVMKLNLPDENMSSIEKMVSALRVLMIKEGQGEVEIF